MPDATTHAPTSTAQWLEYLYGDLEDGWLTLFSIDRTSGERHTDWFNMHQLDAAAERATERAERCCVWAGVATRTERLVGKRGGAEHCLAVPGAWLDVDIADAVHAAEGLPSTEAEAWEIIERFPIKPTAVIDSGHGLQAWWIFTEAVDADEMADILPRWHATWQRIGAPYHIDNVFDLPRIMRLPGTWNRKAEPVPVTVAEADWDHQVDLSLIVDQLDELPEPQPSPTANKWTGDEGLPGQVFNQTHNGGEILSRLGFELDHTDTQGDHYRRPGKTKGQGSSATVYPDGHTTIWSDTVTAQWPALAVRRPYDPFGLYACTEHDGDHRAAAAELERQGYGTLPTGDLPPDEELFSPELLEPAKATEPEPAPRSLSIRWVDDYPANPPPEPDPIIEGLLNAGEFMVIGAERGIGKTWLGYNIASLLTTAKAPLFGRLPIPHTRTALYLQGELDETQAWSRWQMLHEPEDPFTPAELPHLAESFDRVPMRAVERRATVTVNGETFTDSYVDAVIDGRLEATISELGVEVVIVDPWAVYFAGNENSNDQAEAVLSELRRIGMRQRVAWVILHHFGKSREQAEPEDLWRGASRLADWAANRVTIARHYTDRQAAAAGLKRAEARRYADLHFLRRGAPLDGFSIHLEQSGWWQQWESDGDEDAPVTRTGLTRSDVLEALEAEGGFRSLRHAADSLGGASHETVKRVLEQLTVDGWIDAERTPSGAFAYRLPKEARE